MSRRMEATLSAQQRHLRHTIPQASVFWRRPVAVGFAVAWCMVSICIGWWLGAPYLQSAPEQLDALEIARVSKAVQFSRETPIARETPLRAAAKNEANISATTPQRNGFERFVVNHPRAVLVVGGLLTLFSLLIAAWALRQLWLINDSTKRSKTPAAIDTNSESAAAAEPPTDESVPKDHPKTVIRPAVVVASELQPSTSPVRDKARPVPRAEQIPAQSPQAGRRAIVAGPPDEERSNLDLNRIIAEMSLAQNTLSCGDAGKDAA